MTTPTVIPHPARKWYWLALRHLRISSRLLRSGFPDSSFFHSYHAFECAVSAVIAAKGWPVPPDGKTVIYAPKRMVYYSGPGGKIHEPSTHKAKPILFDQVADKSKPYYTTFSTLSRFLTTKARNDALYYDSTNDLLPHQYYNHSQALGCYQQVFRFVKEARAEIP